MLHQIAGSPWPQAFLIGDTGQGKPSLELVADTVQVGKGENRGCSTTLHVVGTATVDAAVNDRSGPRIMRPVLAVTNREHIYVPVKHQVAPL